jgi:hypothetical protein
MRAKKDILLPLQKKETRVSTKILGHNLPKMADIKDDLRMAFAVMGALVGGALVGCVVVLVS